MLKSQTKDLAALSYQTMCYQVSAQAYLHPSVSTMQHYFCDTLREGQKIFNCIGNHTHMVEEKFVFYI